MRWLSIALILAAGGCDRCSREDPPRPASVDLGVASRVEAPSAERVEAMVAAAFADRLDEAGPEAPPAALAWVIPPCSLRYQLQSAHLGEVAEGRAPAGKDALASVVANPGEEGLTLQIVDVGSALLADGERTPRRHQALAWAPTLLRTDGRRFEEIGGPTTLWTSHSVVPALVELFPALPDHPAPGAEIAWEVALHAHGSVARLEERRARGEAVPTLEPTRRQRRVSFERWIAIDGEPAGVLASAWHLSVDVGGPVPMRRGERWLGRWTVLGTGRLIHAALAANTWSESEVSLGEPRAQHGTATIELRLIEACDGPTLPPFDASPPGGPAE